MLAEEQQWNYLTHCWEDKKVHTFLKSQNENEDEVLLLLVVVAVAVVHTDQIL